jgi:hypothetical protein
VDWEEISEHQKLSEDFIREFKDKLDWKWLTKRYGIKKKDMKIEINIVIPKNIPDVYDLINLETISAEDYLKQDKNNIIFVVGGVSMGFNKKEIKRDVIDAGDFFYECKKALKLRVGQDDITGSKLALLRGQGNYFVKLGQMSKLLRFKKDKVYRLVQDRKLKNITHIDAVDVENGGMINWKGQPIRLVSSWHCQDGTEAMLYNIEAM